MQRLCIHVATSLLTRTPLQSQRSRSKPKVQEFDS